MSETIGSRIEFFKRSKSPSIQDDFELRNHMKFNRHKTIQERLFLVKLFMEINKNLEEELDGNL